jgi:hypothetical protein
MAWPNWRPWLPNPSCGRCAGSWSAEKVLEISKVSEFQSFNVSKFQGFKLFDATYAGPAPAKEGRPKANELSCRIPAFFAGVRELLFPSTGEIPEGEGKQIPRRNAASRDLGMTIPGEPGATRAAAVHETDTTAAKLLDLVYIVHLFRTCEPEDSGLRILESLHLEP